MVWRVLCVLLVAGVVGGYMFTRTTTASASGPVPQATTDDALAKMPGKRRRCLPGVLLGNAGRIRAAEGRGGDDGGLCGRIGGDGDLRPGDDGDDRARRIGGGGLRSFADYLWASAADFLFDRARSDATEPAGPDVGTSYRSAIFYTNDEQKRGRAYIAQLEAAHVFGKKIVTEVTPLKGFYRGEDYHQDYALKNPGNPYIQVCDRPKVDLRKRSFRSFEEYTGSGERGAGVSVDATTAGLETGATTAGSE